MFDTMARDVKHALRMFVQSPAFAFAAVAALTLGIAVNTAIFSVVNAVLLRPLPYPDADRVVFFMSTSQNSPAGFSAASPAKFGHFRQYGWDERLAVERDQPLRAAEHEQAGLAAGQPVGPCAPFFADDLRIPLPAIQQFDWRGPPGRIRE